MPSGSRLPALALALALAALALGALAPGGLATDALARGRHGPPGHPPPAPPDRACGVGTLGFGPAVEIASVPRPLRPAHVFVNLLDGDANVDVGVARGRRLYSALGDGAGGFALLEPIAVGRTGRLVDVASGDFDEDGIPDALLVDALRRRSVLSVAGTPGGRLAGSRRAVFLGGRTGPRAAVAGDWNDDGRTDVATANRLSHGVTALTREADGSWSREQVLLPFRPADLLVADVDGDAAPDLVAGSARGDVALLLNRDARFGVEVALVAMHRGAGRGAGASIDAADLDRDGVVDLLSLRADGRLAVRLGEAPDFAGNGGAGAPVFEDAMETRLACAVRGGPPHGSASSHAGRARGREAHEDTQPPHARCRFAGVAVGDVDRDGIADLVATAPRASRDVLVLFGHGDGRFSPALGLRTPRSQAADLRLADVNGDGRLDPVVGARDGGAYALPSRCACRAPFEGPGCEACAGPGCPVGGDVLAQQLTVGPREIVRLGAGLVAASLEPPADLRRAAETAQRLAALALESDAVVVGMPVRDRNELVGVRGGRVPVTVTTFEVQEVLKGVVRGPVEVSQEGGFLGSGESQDSSNRIPFPSADDLAICPGPAGAGVGAAAEAGPYWLLFLRAGAALHSLVGDLTEPAFRVQADNGGFVLREAASGLALPVGELAGLPDGRRAR